jgi:3-methyladenine DNA glycosylase/8-oxoguanine DNA glycosylase
MSRVVTAEIRSALPVDLALTLGPLHRGPLDPTFAVDRAGTFWRAMRTPAGSALLCLVGRGQRVAASAWGPGAACAIEAAPDLVGARDRIDDFAPHGLVADLHRRNPGLRIGRTGAVFDTAVRAVLEQKIAGREAFLQYRALVRAYGTAAFGPAGAPRLLAPPPPAAFARPYWELHAHGIDRRRAIVLRALASRASRLDAMTALDPEEARRRLESLEGIGPWTSGEVALAALGDPDAVPIGDYHLPSLVAFALAGEPSGDDARMLELLAPFAGHRGRVLRLLEVSGIRRPRRGPRRPLRRIARL